MLEINVDMDSRFRGNDAYHFVSQIVSSILPHFAQNVCISHRLILCVHYAPFGNKGQIICGSRQRKSFP